MQPGILHVVRRFGPVGGMERYVWELVHALTDENWKVSVVCEKTFAQASAEINVHALGESTKKPRWLSHLLFSRKVSRFIDQQTDPMIIHSHERTARHHITTFHGPPFAEVQDKPLWQRISPRIWANLWLEKRELSAPNVQAVVPNAQTIHTMLTRYYPEVQACLTAPIIPGVSPSQMMRPNREVSKQGGTVGFVGTEWKRKGLEKFIHIIELLASTRPKIQAIILGPEPEEIRHLIPDTSRYRLIGPAPASEHYHSFDLLIHPATKEPFGMVITEAMAAGVPVLISSQSGASSEVSEDFGTVLDINTPNPQWAEEANKFIGKTLINSYQHSWKEVAKKYSHIYQNTRF